MQELVPGVDVRFLANDAVQYFQRVMLPVGAAMKGLQQRHKKLTHRDSRHPLICDPRNQSWLARPENYLVCNITAALSASYAPPDADLLAAANELHDLQHKIQVFVILHPNARHLKDKTHDTYDDVF